MTDAKWLLEFDWERPRLVEPAGEIGPLLSSSTAAVPWSGTTLRRPPGDCRACSSIERGHHYCPIIIATVVSDWEYMTPEPSVPVELP